MMMMMMMMMMINQVHLHIVFVLLYSVCRSVFFCVDVIHSFTHVLRVDILDVTKTGGVRERERKREAIPSASRRYHKKKKEEE